VVSVVATVTTTEWPTWRYSRLDRQLHLFRALTNGDADTLCGRHAPVIKLEEPTGDEQLRCVDCLTVFSTLARGG
jgi:hypothetical protein